jgi:hypothetical protein
MHSLELMALPVTPTTAYQDRFLRDCMQINAGQCLLNYLNENA